MRATRTVPGTEAVKSGTWGRVTMPFAQDSHSFDARRRQTTGGTMTENAANIVLKEGAEPFGTTHMETLRDEAEALTPEGMEAEEVAARALMLTALEFAGYMHRNAEPMFLHALRIFFEYQKFACIGCEASTHVVNAMLSKSPPTDKQLASTVSRGSETLDDRDIKERLMEALHAVEAGVPFEEAIANIGGRIVMTGIPVDEDEG